MDALIKGYSPRVGFLTWLRSLGQWEDFKQEGIWIYQINTVTGGRRAWRTVALHGGINWQWLNGGAWERQRPVPPRSMRMVSR